MRIQKEVTVTKKFCGLYEHLKEAKDSCECQCNTPHYYNAPYCHCAYGNCCGYKCTVCGKFEVVTDVR